MINRPLVSAHAALVIPTLNEERAIASVLAQTPRDMFGTVIVADNGSTDRTTEIAQAWGALVTVEPRRGYGGACLRALQALPPETDFVVFMDGDGSDDPCDAASLLGPVVAGRADLVLGSRVLAGLDSGALRTHQRFGNAFATTWLAMLYGFRFTDLGPFRAMRVDTLRRLGMQDRGYGWTVEMQIKAIRDGLRVLEVPVPRHPRIAGASKVSGSVRGSLAAGCKILWILARSAMTATGRTSPSSNVARV